MSLGSADGRQYVVSGPWRHRDDIAELIEASRGGQREALIDGLSRELKQKGYRLLVLDYSVESNDPTFYRQGDFRLIERILEYERPTCPWTFDHRRRTEFDVRPIDRPTERTCSRSSELQLFPRGYGGIAPRNGTVRVTPGVEYLAGGSTVALSVTRVCGHRHDGHLDRLAVEADGQGRGLGATLLSAALVKMVHRGAKQISLTTQEQNLRSQSLTNKTVFERGRWAYEIYGRWLDAPEGTDS